MSPRKKARAAFTSALILLLLSGAAAYVSIIQLLETQGWVTRSREVQAAIGELESATVKVGRARMGFVATGDEAQLDDFNSALPEVAQQLRRLKELTNDNPTQRELCASLERVTNQRIELSRQAVELKKVHPHDEQGQDAVTRRTVPSLSETTALTQQMRDEEQTLLTSREKATRRLSAITFTILAVALVLAVAMFFLHYRLLNRELAARERAEQALRGLSSRLIQMQDEERRRFSRELHDSLGQYLVGLKITLEMLAAEHADDPRYSECLKWLEQCIVETRTLSHLLHPPLLDVAGFSSAAKWFVEGFAQRSGVEVKTDIPDATYRLSPPLELALFRVLQESLVNIHRHSKSPKAEVSLKILPREVVLRVRDYGIGVPPDVLTRFRNGGTSGVGLAGMRERVRELGGRFEVDSRPAGTTISVSLPLSEAPQVAADTTAAAD